MNMKGLVLLSGGLDSAIALGVMKRQDVQLEAVSYFSIFSEGMKKGRMGFWARRAAQYFDIKLHYRMVKDEFIEMVKHPQHGYGVGLNPCIDCKILMLRKSKDLMSKIGASFVVTGEVLGERPMSQNRRSIELIEKKSGLTGLIVRPLSGKFFPPTEPEKSGILDREKFLDIHGRGRDRQIELARAFGIIAYPQPAGGCILTDKYFTERIKDLLAFGYTSASHIIMLRYGRHFRFTKNTKAILGRDEKENNILLTLAHNDDTLFELVDIPGPLLVLDGALSEETISKAAALVRCFSKERGTSEVAVHYYKKGKKEVQAVKAQAPSPDEVDAMMIGNVRVGKIR